MGPQNCVISCLNISSKTSVDWRSFCSEVCSNWFLNQEQIGGEGVEVEIDETQFVRKKYERGRLLNHIWLFGGIERVTKKKKISGSSHWGDRRET